MKFLDYIKGTRTGKDAQEIEYSALSDPFMADAIDGYDLFGTNQADIVLRLQADVWARTASNNKDNIVWKIVAAAVVFIAMLFGYSLLMNHQSSMMLAHEQENAYINLYVPESYINQKGLELAELKEANPSQDMKIATAVDIVNIDEVIKPVEKIDIYLPSNYAQHLEAVDVNSTRIVHKPEVVESTNREYLASLPEPEVILPQHSGIIIVEKSTLEQDFALLNPMLEKQTSEKILDASAPENISSSNPNRSEAGASMLAMSKKKKETLSEPVTGYKLYDVYLKENKAQIYDPSCKTTTGVVVLSFKVNSDGRPTNIIIEQGLCNPCNDEAIRLLNEGCDWTQSASRGQLKVYFNEE